MLYFSTVTYVINLSLSSSASIIVLTSVDAFRWTPLSKSKKLRQW